MKLLIIMSKNYRCKEDEDYILNKSSHLHAFLSENPWRQLCYITLFPTNMLSCSVYHHLCGLPSRWEDVRTHSFVLVREASRMSETENWEQGQQILGFWYVVRFLENWAKEIFIGRLEKSTECILNNALIVLLRYGNKWWIQ